jgi:hypothetical protein
LNNSNNFHTLFSSVLRVNNEIQGEPITAYRSSQFEAHRQSTHASKICFHENEDSYFRLLRYDIEWVRTFRRYMAGSSTVLLPNHGCTYYFGVRREMLEQIHKCFKIPLIFPNIPRNIMKDSSDSWQYCNNLRVLQTCIIFLVCQCLRRLGFLNRPICIVV